MKYSVLLLILFSLNVFSQDEIILSETDFNYLKEKVKLHIRQRQDSTLYYCSEIEKSNDNLHKSFAKSYKAYVYQVKGDSLSSDYFLNEVDSILKITNDSFKKKEIETYYYNLSGLIDRKRGKYFDAIEKFEKGKRLSQALNDQKQLIKFNNNIASINSDIGNFNYAIKSLKENDSILNGLKSYYTQKEFLNSKSLISLNLGLYYQQLYIRNKENKYLDSAEFYLNKNLNFSKEFLNDNIKTQINLGIIKIFRNDFKAAEEYFISAFLVSKENKMYYEECLARYNLGDLYFAQNKYDKALVCFKEVNLICQKHNLKNSEYVFSNYFQAKIYESLGDSDKALTYSNIYFDEFNRLGANIINESLKVNNRLGTRDINKDVNEIKQRAELRNNIKYFIVFLFLLTMIGTVFFVIKIVKDKRKAVIKFEELFREFKLKEFDIKNGTSQTGFVINDDKEKEILDKLKNLEEKKYFLDVNFNQQNVAKKIKSNTTYLSYVVNKNYNKTFSEYSNELKLNYVIQELMNNPVYRKYSTQAIAESAGFKSSISFTKSFKKRAGLTPAQFIIELQKEFKEEGQ